MERSTDPGDERPARTDEASGVPRESLPVREAWPEREAEGAAERAREDMEGTAVEGVERESVVSPPTTEGVESTDEGSPEDPIP